MRVASGEEEAVEDIMSDVVLGLELVLSHYQDRLKDPVLRNEKDHYEQLYLMEYHELHKLNKERSKPFMEWWVRYAKW